MSYSMAQVESLTGIKAHTLRIWERRYDFLRPLRTDTNIRYYSDEQLRQLLNISILVRNGYRVSKVAVMSDEEINEHVADVLNDPVHEEREDVQALTIAMLEMSEDAFNKIWRTHIVRKGLLSTIVDLIYPFLEHVGILWGTNKAMPAQEHFISNLIRQKIIAATDALPTPGLESPRLIMYLLDGEDHEIGLLLACYIARELGWKVYYLGQRVPHENIKEVIRITNADLMMTMLITPKTAKKTPDLSRLVSENGVPLIYSGSMPNIEAFENQKDIKFLSNPDAFIDYLNDWNK